MSLHQTEYAQRYTAGFTLLEMVFVVAIFTMVLAGVLSMLNTYQDLFYIQDAMNTDQEEARRCIEAVKADLLETTVDYVFTNFWTAGTQPRNTISDFGLRQCANSACTWIYQGGSTVYKYPNRYLLNYKWSTGDLLCPICGQASTLTITNDALALYSPRENPTLGRSFMHLDDTGAAQWRSIIFYFTYYDATRRQMQLRRAQLYLSDIDPNPVKNFGDLLTFPAQNHQHIYMVGGKETGKDTYWFYLYLHRRSDDGTKETRFQVRQGSMYATNAYIYVKHPNVNNGNPWTRNFDTEQKVIGTHVVDVDFSTADSNSVTGTYIDPTSVRMTIAVQSTPYVRSPMVSSSTPGSETRSRVRPVTTVLSTMLHPRN